MGRTIAARFSVTMIALAAALAVWGVAKLAGLDLELKDGAPIDSVEMGDVITAVVLGGVLASLVYAGISRLGWTGWWPFAGSTALAISMIGPSYYADGADAMALMAMHFAAGIVIIAGFARVLESDWCCERPSRSTPAPSSQPR